MKAIINALAGGKHKINNITVPSCLCKVHSDITILEQQISLLNLNGFGKNDITVIVGQDDVWNSQYVKSYIENRIAIIKYKIKQNSSVTADILEDNQDYIIMSGNFVMDIATIARLLRYKRMNVAVISKYNSPDFITEKKVFVDSDGYLLKESYAFDMYPWHEYVGISKMSYTALKTIVGTLGDEKGFINSLYKINGDNRVSTIEYDDLINGRLNGEHSNELTGGSYSKLNYRFVVKKEAEGEGREKLINEINWLLSIPKEIQPYFSKVLEYDITSKKVYYNVPYYGKRNLREYIFAGYYDSNDTIRFLNKLLHWMFENVYSREIGCAPENWVIQKHINRVLDRLPIGGNKSDELNRLINAEKIIINGIEYKNVRELYENFLSNKEFIKRLNPRNLVMIHGDLHFQNILLSNETDYGFILVDPRGEHMGSDIYYDMGKLLHSFHAKYDFVHSDQFKLCMDLDREVPVASYEFTNSYMVKVYNDIYKRFLDLVKDFDYFKQDPDWELKAYFAEASHLCSVMPFHIGKTNTPDRVVTLYLIGVQLINEFYDKYIEK